jgi:hypothetical protein
MKTFDLHPKAATYARKKTPAGGILTITTVAVAILLLFFRAKLDLGKRVDDIRIDSLHHDDSLEVTLEVAFTELSACNGQYQVEVLDALSRVVKDPKATLSIRFYGRECHVSGSIHVPPGKGTFRIYPFNVALENMYANHRIDKLMIGAPLSGVPYEARSLATEAVHQGRSGAWSYYLSLVPTTSNEIDGYQIAATRTFVELSSPMTVRGSLYFHYEASPVRMVMNSSVTFLKMMHFFARSIGIISGLFAFVGLAREVLFTTVSAAPMKKRKKSELVM